MRSVVSVRRWALGAAVAAIVALAGAASAAAASTPAVWSPATPFTSVPSGAFESAFSSVTCASAGNCIAVGLTASSTTNQQQAIVAVESSGTWGPSTTLTASVLPSNADSTGNYILSSVSCTSASSCEAVGSYMDNNLATQALAVPIAVSGQTATPGQGVEVTLPADADPTLGAQNAALNGVSCNASGCVAVGSYGVATANQQAMTATGAIGGPWTATALTKLPSNAGAPTQHAALYSISCPSGGACEAVGSYTDNTAGNDQRPMAVTVTGGTAGQAAEVGLPADYVPTGATSNFVINEGTALSSVSCPSAGTCTAVGAYSTSVGPPTVLAAVAVPINGGTPGTAVALQLPPGAPSGVPGVPSGGGVTSISCTDADDCSVFGYLIDTNPVAVTGAESGGTWSTLSTLPFSSTSGSSISVGIGIDCFAAARCEGVGLVETSLAGGTSIPFTAVSAPQLSVTTSSLPAAQVGKPYSATLQAAGGTGSDTWSLGPGALPAGLSFSAATRVISGTPTASGQSGFVVTDTDAGPPAQNVSAGLSITVNAATPPTPVASVKVLYLKAAGKKATVVMSCSGAPCKGSLKVVGVERRKGKKVTGVVASKSTKHRITLASGRYSIAAGGGKTAVLTLSGKASRLLTRLHKVAGYLNVTPTGATHPAVVKKVKFTSPAKHHNNKQHKHHSKKHKRHKKK